MSEPCTDLERFMRGEMELGAFAHREHLRMGFEMLHRYDFAETLFRYSKALRAMAARAGKPQAFHQTVTVAFLALIAERIGADGHTDFDSFARANPDLLERAALERWYPRQRLASDAAKRTFVLPEPRCTIVADVNKH